MNEWLNEGLNRTLQKNTGFRARECLYVNSRIPKVVLSSTVPT